MKVRLNFVSASWTQALESLADQSGLELVMHDTPPGRYSRSDLRQYSLEEALRIINNELEPLGFRCLATDRHLTVIRAERARTEYPRRELSAPDGDSGDLPAYRMTSDTGVTTAGYESVAGGPRDIQRTSGETQPESEGEATSVRLTPQNRPAIEISRDIFGAFQKRATVQDVGPHGLPSFTVWREGRKGEGVSTSGEWFTIELDTQTNTVVLSGARDVTVGLTGLIKRLDSVPRTENETTHVIAGDRALPNIGRQLQPQLDRLKVDPNTPVLAAAWQGAGAEVEPADGAAADGQATATIPGFSGNLRGDVTIQSVDDLNLLIIRGNEADVEQVLQVIQLIENQAEGSQPEITVLNLKHVSSEALAELLTDVYEQVTDQLEDGGRAAPTISVIPVVQPNSVIILAPATAMKSIEDLATTLDQPSDPAAEVQVIRLKSAIASQVVELLDQFYEDRPGLGTRVRAIADVRTNSVIVQARPRELAEIQLLIRRVDRDDSNATHQAQVIQLQHASAEELAEFLNTALQNVTNSRTQTGAGGAGAGGQNNQQLQDTKSVVLEFLRTNGDVKRLIKSGLLIDVRISGDPRTNTLLVTAPRDSMPLLQELITVLDQPSQAVASVRMIPLTSADAVAAVELLETLFEPQQEEQLGVQLAGAETESSLVPLRFQADPRSNTVIAYGGEEALTMVEAILLRLDAGDLRNRQVEVIKLRNAPATDVATAINQFLTSQRELLLQDPDRISSVELLEQDIVVTPEPVNNYLLISATPKYFDRIMKMAKELDSAPPQVMIQALLVEVELNDTDEFGIELGFQDSVLFNRSVIDNLVTTTTSTNVPGVGTTQTTNIISQSGTPGFLFNNTPLGNNTGVNTRTVGAQSLSNFALGRVNGDLGFGGLVLSASSESVSVLIRALQSRRNVRILSRPQILALDNQQAQIQVGQQVPVVDGVTTNVNGVASPNVRQDQAGIILTVTPRISPEGEIVMVVAAEKSAFLGNGVPIYTDTAGNVFTSPIKDITTATSTIKIVDGQTIVLGGMITKSDTTLERKVPYLGDIPVVKNLFRYDSHTERRTELLIFLTPRIVHGDGDAELIKQVEAERLHFFEEEAEAIHGPLFSIPAEEYGFYPATHGGAVIQNGTMAEPVPTVWTQPGAMAGPTGTAGGSTAPAVPAPLFSE